MKYFIGIFVQFSVVLVMAQNRTNLSQYMINQGVFNPAYFDDDMALSGTVYHRNQWVGVNGAPESYLLTAAYNMGNHGVHLNALNDRITVVNNTQFGVGYHYVLRLDKKNALSLGVNGSLGKFSALYNQLQLASANDNVFQNRVNANFLNFGAGLHFQNDNVFFGVSAPYLFNNQLKNSGTLVEGGLIKNHIYAMGGARFGTERFLFTPTTMVKYVSGAPIQMDLDFNAIVNERMWFGLGGRTDKTFKCSVGVFFSNNIKLVYTYDAGLFAEFYNAFGGHEISLSYGNSFYSNKFSKRKYLTRKATFKRRIRR